MNSGTKLAIKMARKIGEYQFQGNEIAPSTFSTPRRLRIGKAIPSTMQWTLPQDRPLMKQVIPIHPTASAKTVPIRVSDMSPFP
jgi:hypothetical protein